ncbi:MAG: AAA family ATPase [Candidatus Aenigmatarchaeota archaeon]
MQSATFNWIQKHGWSHNPFTFSILPDLFVGYQEQINRLISAVDEKQKLILLIGPTGSGKTTFLRHIETVLDEDFIYLSKPPKSVEDLIWIFNHRYSTGVIFKDRAKGIHHLTYWLNGKIKRHLVVLVDEAHETNQDILEWFRAISDQIDNITIVLSGLPSFEDMLRRKLETLRARASTKIELLSLTKDAMTELIRKRIEHVGGTDQPFIPEVIDYIYERSAGFPREVLRICDSLINKAAKANIDLITVELLRTDQQEEQKINIEALPDKQRKILELLIKPSTPVELTSAFPEYLTQSAATRAINNILNRLAKSGYVERKRQGKTYLYNLAPRVQTIFIKA